MTCRQRSDMITSRTSLAMTLLCLIGVLAEAAVAQIEAPSSIKRSELFRPLPLTKFYDTAEPLPPGKPGELIRSAEFDEYNLPEDVNAVRLLYHSRSAVGDVAVSGVVLFPDGKPPIGGWPVIAWAHSWNALA